jgi:hypothetical protein
VPFGARRQGLALRAQDPALERDPRGGERRGRPPPGLGIAVLRARHDTRDAGRDDVGHARRRLLLRVRARLERHDQRAAPRAIARVRQRRDLGVRSAPPRMVTAPHDGAGGVEHDGAHHGVGLDAEPAAERERDRLGHRLTHRIGHRRRAHRDEPCTGAP